MTLFKGYAEAKGFRPVRIHDISGKILAQGRTKMRGMEKALESNRRQDANIVRQLEREAQIEKDNYDKNFQLKKKYGDVLAKAEWKNLERGIKNAETRRKQRETDMRTLLKFVPTGLKIVKAWDAKREADATNLARDLNEKWGIGSRHLNAANALKQSQIEEATNTEGFISLAGDKMPLEMANRLRSLGGYQTVKIHELTAQRIGKARYRLYADKLNTNYTIGGQEVNLADAPDDVRDLIFARISREQREEMGDNFPSSAIWHSSGAADFDVNARATINKDLAQRSHERSIKEQHDDEIKTLQHLTSMVDKLGRPYGSKGVLETIYHYAGGPNASGEALSKARSRVIPALIAGVKARQIDPDIIKGLEKLEFSPRGTTKPVFFSDHFKKDWPQLEKAMAAAVTEENQIVNALGPTRRDTADVNMQNQMIDLDASEEVGPEAWAKFAGVAKSKGYTKTHQWIVDKIATGQNAEMDVTNGLILKQRMDRNEIVTDEEIDRMQMSESARNAAKVEARNNNRFLPQGETVKTLETIVKDELERIIPAKSEFTSSASHTEAAKQAYSEASGHYRTHFEKHGSVSEATQYAWDQIAKDIRNPDGKYAKGEVQSDGTYAHRGFQADTSQDRIRMTNPATIKLELGKDRNRIYTHPYIPKTAIREKLDRLSRGLRTGPLAASEVLRSQTGIPTIDTLLAQREYWANKEIAETGKTTLPEVPEWYIKDARKTESLVSPGPKTQRLLTYYNPVYVNEALVKSGSNIAYTDPLYNKVRPAALQVSGSDYNSIGDGMSSFESRGYRLIGQTVRSILEIFEAGNLQVAGAYHLNGDQIKKGMESAGLSYDRMFDTKTQDLIFNTLFKIGGYELPPAATGYEALLRDNVLKSLNGGAKKNTTHGYHSPELVSTKALEYLFGEGRYATTT